MYYAEKAIEGVLHFKTTSNGKWKPVTLKIASKRIMSLEKRVQQLEQKLNEVDSRTSEARQAEQAIYGW